MFSLIYVVCTRKGNGIKTQKNSSVDRAIVKCSQKWCSGNLFTWTIFKGVLEQAVVTVLAEFVRKRLKMEVSLLAWRRTRMQIYLRCHVAEDSLIEHCLACEFINCVFYIQYIVPENWRYYYYRWHVCVLTCLASTTNLLAH